MITRIEATRYRCFDKLDVELGDFRVLVGANGSGKTTLLDIPVLLGDMLKARTIGDAFLRERDHRAPRASGFRELIFQGKGDSFIVAVEAALPEKPARDLLEGMTEKARAKEERRPTHLRYEVRLQLFNETELQVQNEYLFAFGGERPAEEVREVLLWQDNVNVDRGRWPEGVKKPAAPKELIQALIRANHAGPPAVVYSEIAKKVSTQGCVDPAFHRIRNALRAWFPAEGT